MPDTLPNADLKLQKMANTPAEQEFAARLIRSNMASYHRQYDMHWCPHSFGLNWPLRSNFRICARGTTIGILSMSLYNEHAYIRELQIVPAQRNRGAGSWALQQAEFLARRKGCQRLRLKVFINNPALGLYDRHGFQIKMRENSILGMEKHLGHQAEHSL